MCYLKQFTKITAILLPKDFIIDEIDNYKSDQSFFQTKMDDVNFDITKL